MVRNLKPLQVLARESDPLHSAPPIRNAEVRFMTETRTSMGMVVRKDASGGRFHG